MEDQKTGNEVQSQSDSGATEKEDFVSKKAYEDIKTDMFKYKDSMRNMEAELNKLRADKDAAEKEKLEQEGKWKELFEKTRAEKENIAKDLSESKKKFVDFHKKNAVISKLGGLKKDDYAKFINSEAIEVEDNGRISEASVEAEVNRLKENFPELIKANNIKEFNNIPARKAEVPNPAKRDKAGLQESIVEKLSKMKL